MEPITANAVGGSHEINLKVPAPTIDSETGERVKCNKDQIIPEIKEHSFYLMQTLRIGNSECLTFFGPGANTHLVDGNIAEREGLQMISDKTSAIRIVGGSEIKTEHGVYRFNLGPGEENVYHEIVAIGMSLVTSEFAKYGLSEICKEYKDEAAGNESQAVLPEAIGGSRVHLLLGIKNTKLHPILIKILPSGVGVFLSPFKDKWGSRIIFAGPSKAFTTGNNDLKTDISHEVFSIHQDIEREENLREEVNQVHFSIPVNDKLGLAVDPYAFSKDDYLELGGETETTLEEKVDNELFLEDYIWKNNQLHYCSVNKAMVPIAKMRELMDIDDLDDTVPYRCPLCAKCFTSKRSQRRTAISLQEAREQQIIEDSVKISLEEKRVIVTYPFLKDPVNFITQRHKGSNNYNQALKVYKSQCRKSVDIREGMRKVQRELVDKDFMSKLSKLRNSKPY